MKGRLNVKNFTLILSLIIFGLILPACDGQDGGGPDYDTQAQGVAFSGSFSFSYYEAPNDTDYESARIYYPTNGVSPYSATTLSGGWSNTKEDMYWMAEHLSSHGFIVIDFTPNDNLSNNSQWREGQLSCYDMLITENSNLSSPIYNKVDTVEIGLMGFSKGGGAVLMACDDKGSNVSACVSMAPYIDTGQAFDFNNIAANVMVIGGDSDTIAVPDHQRSNFDLIKDTTLHHTFVSLAGIDHFAFFGEAQTYGREAIKQYITAFLKKHLYDDSINMDTYLTGTIHQGNVDDSWFATYLIINN